MSVLVMTNAEKWDTPSRWIDITGRNSLETIAASRTLVSMKPHRAVVCTLGAVLALSGCTDTPTAAVEASRTPIDGWQSIPDFPLTPRTEPVVAWTGQELLVIGGVPGPPCPQNADCVMPEFARDGAAYDPETRMWTELPDAPVGIAAAPAVIVGGTLFTALTKASERTRLLSYDMATSAWVVYEAPDGLSRTPVDGF